MNHLPATVEPTPRVAGILAEFDGPETLRAAARRLARRRFYALGRPQPVPNSRHRPGDGRAHHTPAMDSPGRSSRRGGRCAFDAMVDECNKLSDGHQRQTVFQPAGQYSDYFRTTRTSRRVCGLWRGSGLKPPAPILALDVFQPRIRPGYNRRIFYLHRRCRMRNSTSRPSKHFCNRWVQKTSKCVKKILKIRKSPRPFTGPRPWWSCWPCFRRF